MEENQRKGAAGRRSPRPVGAVSAASIAGKTAKQFRIVYHSSLMPSGRGLRDQKGEHYGIRRVSDLARGCDTGPRD